MPAFRLLALETSCDETAAAVLADGRRVLSNVVSSQAALHAPWGGVVPELAARHHLENLAPVTEAALGEAGLALAEVDAIAVTAGPGLIGSLLAGVQFAKGLAFAARKPLVPVHHIAGHLEAPFLAAEDEPALPAIALCVSGGHTSLFEIPARGVYRLLGRTRDDAAGEAFDKVAKALGLGYPGGPVIDRLAKEGNPDAIPLARPMPSKATLEFSFSGLKTNVARWVEEHGRPGDDQTLRDVCATFQRRVVDTLVKKAMLAVRQEGVQTLVLGGGVAANRELRERAHAAGEKAGLRVVVPAFRACTDNAAMIAFAGLTRLARGEDDSDTLTTSPRTSLETVTRKGRGRRG